MPEKRMTSMRFSVKVALRSPPKSSKRLQKSLSAQTAQAVHPHQTANFKHRCNGRPPLGFQSHRTSDSQGKGIGVSDGLRISSDPVPTQADQAPADAED